jgi:P4 family phage/plasmid primase-like protien
MSEVSRGAPGSWQYLGWWKDGALDLGETRAQLPASDQDAALLLAMERPGELHHVPGLGRSGTWYIWDGKCHRPDESAAAERMIMAFAHRAEAVLTQCRQAVYAAEASRLGPGATMADIEAAVRLVWKTWDPQVRYLSGLKTTARSRSLLAKLAEVVGCSENDLADRWPGYLNCANGVVCLRTGQIYPHDPRWMMTYCLDVAYVPGARGAGWEQLVWHVARENAMVAAYLVRMLGYSMLGDNREQLIFFMNGDTGSGKSQVVEAVAGVLGPVSQSAAGALISRSQHGERHARVENSVVGMRFVYIDESAERIRIDEGQLKRITGAGTISVNRLYAARSHEVKVTWAVWTPTNDMPTLPGFDDAIRRRVRLIPCGTTIPEAERIKKLGELLAATEGEAILASLVSGCMDYFAHGEQRPAEVELATAEYEAQQKTEAAFREECTTTIPMGGWNGQVWATRPQIWVEYVAWCRETRSPLLPKHTFFKMFAQLPGILWDDNQRRYPGLMITSSYRKDHNDAGI